MSYITDEEAVTYCGTTIAADGPDVAAARLTAEMDLNSWCQRDFNVPTAATARTFVPVYGASLLRVPDIANTTGLVVSDDGATLVLGTDMQLEIAPGMTSQVTATGETRPYGWIRLLGSWWSFDNGRATVTVTARWGWPAVPEPIKLATKLLTRDYFTSRNTTFGVQSFGADGFTRRVGQNSQVTALLAPYRSVEAWGVA